jgi:hypothetical protein
MMTVISLHLKNRYYRKAYPSVGYFKSRIAVSLTEYGTTTVIISLERPAMKMYFCAIQITLLYLIILRTCAGCLPGPECAARLSIRGLHRVHGQQEWLSQVYFPNSASQIQICGAGPVWDKDF